MDSVRRLVHVGRPSHADLLQNIAEGIFVDSQAVTRPLNAERIALVMDASHSVHTIGPGCEKLDVLRRQRAALSLEHSLSSVLDDEEKSLPLVLAVARVGILRAGDTWPTLPSILMLVLSALYDRWVDRHLTRATIGSGLLVTLLNRPYPAAWGQPVRRMPPIGHQVRIVRQTPARGAHMKKAVDWPWPWPKPAVQINREEVR
jgi:hypothetical protein